MLAYSKSIILNTLLVNKVKHWCAHKLLSTEQFDTINNANKEETFSPLVFIKMGLFIFTGILFFAVMGLFSLFFGELLFDNSFAGSIIYIIFGAGSFWILEYFIKTKKHYNSGVDDALLYIGCVLTLKCIYIMVCAISGESTLFCVVLSIPLFAFLALRYIDRIMTLCLCSALFYLVALMVFKFGDAEMKVLPFAMMLATGVVYAIIKKQKSNELYVYWRTPIQMAEVYSLMLFYASCNYFVITEIASSMFDVYLIQGDNYFLRLLFYVLTALVPLVYIAYALLKKDKLLLWIGLLITALSAFTFKKYFSMGHPEILLTVVGMLLIALAYITINYFKTTKHGISYLEDADDDNFLKTNAEALIIAQSFSSQTTNTTTPDSTIDFGGGQGGGAGSGGEF